MRLAPAATHVDAAERARELTRLAAHHLGGSLDMSHLLGELSAHACLIGATQ